MDHLSFLTFIMLILASYRLTHLIVFDKITEFIRKPFMKKKRIVDQNGHVDEKSVRLLTLDTCSIATGVRCLVCHLDRTWLSFFASYCNTADLYFSHRWGTSDP